MQSLKTRRLLLIRIAAASWRVRFGVCRGFGFASLNLAARRTTRRVEGFLKAGIMVPFAGALSLALVACKARGAKWSGDVSVWTGCSKLPNLEHIR